MFKKINSSIATLLLVTSTAMAENTEVVIYDINPDPVLANADTTNTKYRPFVVDKDEYPFKSHWYSRDGISMHYVDEGEGIPIVLTHGNPDWSFLNRNIIKDMSKDARVIAFDLPGFGFSDTPPGYGYTPQEHSEWVESLIFDHLKLDKFIMVVQDWGGPIGLNVATNHPDSIHGVVISNTWAWRSEGNLVEFSNMMRKPEMQKKLFDQNFFAAGFMPKYINKESASNKAITDAYAHAFPTPESRTGTAVFPKQIVDAGDWLERMESRLHTLSDKPVQLIFGMKDKAVGTPDIIERWRTHYPQADVLLLQDADHFTPEDSPESFSYSLRKILKKIQ